MKHSKARPVEVINETFYGGERYLSLAESIKLLNTLSDEIFAEKLAEGDPAYEAYIEECGGPKRYTRGSVHHAQQAWGVRVRSTNTSNFYHEGDLRECKSRMTPLRGSKQGGGRKSPYSPEYVRSILSRIEEAKQNGLSAAYVARVEGLSPSTVQNWVRVAKGREALPA